MPLWLLYELGVLVAGWMLRNKSRERWEESYQPMSIDDMDKEFDRIEDEQKNVP